MSDPLGTLEPTEEETQSQFNEMLIEANTSRTKPTFEDDINTIARGDITRLGGGDKDDEESSDSEDVLEMIKELEPELAKKCKENYKQFADDHVISRYLLGSFINGELSIDQVSKLGDRTSRRKLFKKIA